MAASPHHEWHCLTAPQGTANTDFTDFADLHRRRTTALSVKSVESGKSVFAVLTPRDRPVCVRSSRQPARARTPAGHTKSAPTEAAWAATSASNAARRARAKPAVLASGA